MTTPTQAPAVAAVQTEVVGEPLYQEPKPLKESLTGFGSPSEELPNKIFEDDSVVEPPSKRLCLDIELEDDDFFAEGD